MSVLIKGMEMPKSCAECRFNCDMFMSGHLNGFKEGAYDRHCACPLVEVQTPHGRLIDADKLIAGRVENDNTAILLKNAPVIIEAEANNGI